LNETVQSGLKQEDASLLFNFDSEYAMRKVQQNRGELKCDWVISADYVNLLGDNTKPILTSPASK
jgi:hypothetical protein